jgi:hypothetical protein
MYRLGACGNPTGDFVVVWQSDNHDGSGYAICAGRDRRRRPPKASSQPAAR